MASLAAVITAVATVLTALGGLALAFAVLVPTMRSARDAVNASNRAAAKTDDVHVLVNQRFTDMQRYTEALQRAITDLGGVVPVDQSIAQDPPYPAPCVRRTGEERTDGGTT